MGRQAQGALAALMALLALALLASSPRIVTAMGLNADLSAPLAIADTAAGYADAQIAAGRLGWWQGLWLLQALHPLPGSLALATWLPLLVTVMIGVAVALQARRIWSNLSALVCGAIFLGVSAQVWVFQASWSARATTWWSMALVGMLAVAVAGERWRGSDGRALLLAAAALAASVQAGIALSGDALAVAATLVPLVAAVGAAVALARWSTAAALVGVGGLIVAVGKVASSYAGSHGYLQQDYPVRLIPSDAIVDALGAVARGVASVWRGDPGLGYGAAPPSAVGAATAAVALLGLVAGLVATAHALAVKWNRHVRAAGRAIGRGQAEQIVWGVYWGTAVAALLAAYWLTTPAHVPDDNAVARYLYGLPLAAGAMAAFVAGVGGRRRQIAVSAVAFVFVGTALLGIVSSPPGRGMPAELDDVVELARSQGISRGYAGYWNSYPIAYAGRNEIEVTPVGTCLPPRDGRLCAMYLHYVDQAYRERPGRSFLVVDAREDDGIDFPPSEVAALPANLTPVARHTVAPGLTFYVFDHDIAREIEANAELGDPRIGFGGPLAPS